MTHNNIRELKFTIFVTFRHEKQKCPATATTTTTATTES